MQSHDFRVLTVCTIVSSDGRFPYSKSKIKIFFPKSKKSKSRFYNKLVRQFLLTWNTFILSW